MTKVSVVILNYNGRDFLDKFLPGFMTTDAEIVVVDNGSTDDSVQLLKSKFEAVTLLQFAENHGFTGGYNLALQQINTEYVAIVNSDIEVTEGWLFPLISFLDAHLDYAAVQPKIKSHHQKNQFEYAGAAGGFVDAMGYPYCRGRIFETIENDEGQYDEIVDVDWTSGACMLIRTIAFKESNGFDNGFFAHMEEVDLCWRLRAKGWKLACIPESVVFHVGGGTLKKTSPQKTYLNFRNGLALLVKNMPTKELCWKLPLRLILDGLAAVKFAFESSPAHLLSILKAHLHFYSRLPSLFKMRNASATSHKVWIVWQYFIKSKKRYSDLDQ